MPAALARIGPYSRQYAHFRRSDLTISPSVMRRVLTEGVPRLQSFNE